MQRWELVFLIGGVLLMAAAAGFVAWQTPAAIDRALDCLRASPDATPSSECQSAVDWAGYLSGASTIVQGATTVVPLAVGILLGAPLISREIEKRTAQMAWSLSPNRSWWLLGRVLPVLVAVAVALLLLGAATEAMILASPDAELGFRQYAMHGPLVAARGVAIFGIGVVIGLVMGRVLPAILVTGLVAIVLMGGLQIGRDQLMRAEATWVKADEGGMSEFTTIYDQAFMDDATGELVSYEVASARFPDLFEQGPGIPPGFTQVYLGTPPERYPLFVAREMAALLVVSIIVGAAGLWVVRWRRPDTS